MSDFSLTQAKEKELFRLINNDKTDYSTISNFLAENHQYINLNNLKNYIYTNCWTFFFQDYKNDKITSKKDEDRLINIIELFLEYGLDVNSLFPIREKGGNASFKLPLCMACIYRPFLIKTLVEHGAKVNETQSDQESPLYLVHIYHSRHTDLLFYLLDQGADPTITSVWNKSPLKEASFMKLYRNYKKRKIIMETL